MRHVAFVRVKGFLLPAICLLLVFFCLSSAANRVYAQTLAYVTHVGDDSVSVINTDTNTVINSVVVGTNPSGIAITPDPYPSIEVSKCRTNDPVISVTKVMSHRTRIMYIEDKSEDLVGPARIGRVTYSKTGKSLTYRGRELHSLKGTGAKSNFADVKSGVHYWISGCKKDGLDSLYANLIEIDEDVRDEYWVKSRNKPELKHTRSFKCPGKYSK